MTENEEIKLHNIPIEILFVGCFYKQPDLYVSWGQYIKSKYDLHDEATRFFYDTFEIYYKSFSQTTDETKVNTFMSQDQDRLKLYKMYGGYKTLNSWMKLANSDDFQNYYNTVKKYSLIREFERGGYNVEKIMKHKKFNDFTANDIYKLIRSKVDKINTIILSNEESAILNSENENTISSLLLKPQMGLEIPWGSINEMFRGCRLKKMIVSGFLSNEGKTRMLMKLISYITLVLGEKFLLMSNEMDEEDLRTCLITTVVNNKEFKSIHGIDIIKPEKEIVLGQYRDINGDFILRKQNEWGDFIESEQEYISRVMKNSPEYKKLLEIGKWIDGKKDKQIFFKDVGMDYSDQTLEFELRKHALVYGVKYSAYDTLKGFQGDEWQTVKQTTTRLKELVKEIKMFNWSVFQLTDDTVYTDIFGLSSNNIANAKQLKHVVDHMILGKRLAKEEYHKYEYVSTNTWGTPSVNQLDLSKTYYGWKVEKNRGGNKDRLALIEVNLDYNTWYEVGYLIKKGEFK